MKRFRETSCKGSTCPVQRALDGNVEPQVALRLARRLVELRPTNAEAHIKPIELLGAAGRKADVGGSPAFVLVDEVIELDTGDLGGWFDFSTLAFEIDRTENGGVVTARDIRYPETASSGDHERSKSYVKLTDLDGELRYRFLFKPYDGRNLHRLQRCYVHLPYHRGRQARHGSGTRPLRASHRLRLRGGADVGCLTWVWGALVPNAMIES